MTALHIGPRPPVLVVAQDNRVRAALAAIVAANAGVELSGQVASGVEARRLLARDSRHNTVVVDLDVPVPAGPLALVADLVGAHDVIALSAGPARALSAISVGAVAVASTVDEVEEAIWSTTARRTGADVPEQLPGHTSEQPASDQPPSAQPASAQPASDQPASEQEPEQDGHRDTAHSMSRTDLVAVLIAVFLPPWVFWFSAIVKDTGLIGWLVPQGATLWSMVLPPLSVVAWRFRGRPPRTPLQPRKS